MTLRVRGMNLPGDFLVTLVVPKECLVWQKCDHERRGDSWGMYNVQRFEVDIGWGLPSMSCADVYQGQNKHIRRRRETKMLSILQAWSPPANFELTIRHNRVKNALRRPSRSWLRQRDEQEQGRSVNLPWRFWFISASLTVQILSHSRKTDGPSVEENVDEKPKTFPLWLPL